MQQVGAPLGLDATAAAAGDRARRQRPDGRRDPHGEPRARPRSARLRPVRLRRRRPAARRRAGAELGIPQGADPGAARPHQRARLPGRRPAPRLRRHRQPAAGGARPRTAIGAVLAAQIAARPRRCSSARTWRPSASRRCIAPTCSSRARATSCRWRSPRPRSRIDELRSRLRRRLLEALRRRAARDPPGAGQPAHRRDRQAPAGLARRHRRRPGRRRRSRKRSGRRGRSGSTRLPSDADLRPRAPAGRRPLRGPAIIEQLDCTTVIEPGTGSRWIRSGI